MDKNSLTVILNPFFDKDKDKLASQQKSLLIFKIKRLLHLDILFLIWILF